MLKKRFRILWLSRNGIDITQYNFSFSQICLIFSLLFIVFLTIGAVIIGATTTFFHSYKVAALENDREKLQHELLSMKEKVSNINQRLAQLEDTGDDLRVVANLSAIDNDIRQVGVGGPSYYSELDFLNYPDEISETAMEIRLDLDKLERSLQLEKNNLTEIALKLQERQDYFDHLPSICPVVNGKITERFGYRIHPITNKPQIHKGVDISGRIGTKVLASAGGTVVKVRRKYKPNVSYGKEVVIDHGNGFQTRYAHLNQILVKPGQRVKRWDTIGEVGETGATTGPHLHYEVIVNEDLKNPEYYIMN
ncbi:M23 family metallopeptidase [bacterium]|nr:M23 family metallopeptidase [bacterium]